MKRTLAMGLYLRFRKEFEEDKNSIKENSIFIKQDPLLFESFVADVCLWHHKNVGYGI